MKTAYIKIIFVGIIFFIQSGCSVKWTEAIQYGRVYQSDFNETVNLEIRNNLIFVPITINATEYLFLLDSGAPFSISEELQNEHAFKKLSNGNIIDSDHNRKKVSWVQVDSLHIGNIEFINQTAFVGNFNTNPILNCLGIDGIIGSNLMRHCNWTIDQEQKKLSLSNTIDKKSIEKSITIPFRTDHQYNIFLNINFGQALVKNVLLDYGANGSVTLNEEIFATLKEKGIIGETFLEKGVQQTGIIGKPIDINQEITRLDSVRIINQQLDNVDIKTGKTVSIGNKVLLRFIVTIDWKNKNLYLTETEFKDDFNPSYGYKIGYTYEKGMYIQSVIENSNAQKLGVMPNMQVAKIDTLDFENGNDFCDYLKLNLGETVFLELIDSKGQRKKTIIPRQ